jgi:hypothetical protein
LLCFSKKPYTLAELEPGSSVPEADAMSTAPRRQRFLNQSTSARKLRPKLIRKIGPQLLLLDGLTVDTAAECFVLGLCHESPELLSKSSQFIFDRFEEVQVDFL